MSKFKKTFHLKQHTPLIHFQSEQEGASLRATELKPKLDAFLIKQLGGVKKINNKWLVGKGKTEHIALDYKVKIKISSSDTEEIEKKYTDNRGRTRFRQHPLYFGNMGKEGTEERKCFVWCKDIECEFFSFNQQLLQEIENHFITFMATHNFGTRQSKGFGSFYVLQSDEHHRDFLDVLKNNLDYFVYFKIDTKKRKTVYSDIEFIYKLMKTGFNYDMIYHKGFLFKYFLKKNIGNEKRLIKEKLFPYAKKVSGDGLEKKYVRAVLGINESVEFKDRKDNRIGVVKYEHEDIERFKSPITFKVVGDFVAIIPKDLHGLLKIDKPFLLSQKSNKASINLPNEEDFDLKEFLLQFVDYFNALCMKYYDEPQSYNEYQLERVETHLVDKYEENTLRGVLKSFVHALECELEKFSK